VETVWEVSTGASAAKAEFAEESVAPVTDSTGQAPAVLALEPASVAPQQETRASFLSVFRKGGELVIRYFCAPGLPATVGADVGAELRVRAVVFTPGRGRVTRRDFATEVLPASAHLRSDHETSGASLGALSSAREVRFFVEQGPVQVALELAAEEVPLLSVVLPALQEQATASA